MSLHSLSTNGVLSLALSIVIGAFISEDGATVAAATLAATGLLRPELAFISAVAGLWIGDLGVYALARAAGHNLSFGKRLANWISNKVQAPSVTTSIRQRSLLLGLSRFVPGTRLPAYVSAGFFRMPLAAFAVTTVISASLQTLVVFLAISCLPAHSFAARHKFAALALFGVSVFAILTAWKFWGRSIFSRVNIICKKLRRWEFWPAWLFYLPVGLIYLWLAIRFRSLSQPTIANPGQRNGGIIGESKFEILQDLARVAPAFTAEAFVLETGALSERLVQLDTLCIRHKITYPFVLKPDTAQRGAGFRKVHNRPEAESYLAQVDGRIVLQKYAAGPHEAGIFYYRMPGEPRGHIFAITKKEFPFVVGDGIHTFEELIRADHRASLIASTYLKRFGNKTQLVVPPGFQLQLVEAGNHCQGCIFRNGAYLNSELLRDAIDRISQALPGFFIGRFDVRYRCDDDLRQGKSFKIVELNGAAAEDTSIYDQRNSLWSAYKTLYRQWELVFQIGSANRELGHKPVGLFGVWRDWQAFHKQAALYPLAD